MRRPELDHIITSMLDSQPEVSDLLFTVDKPLQVEAVGSLQPVALDPPIEKLTPFQTEMVALNLVGDNPWHLYDLLAHGSCDAAYSLADKARFRINVFSQRGNTSIVARKLNTIIPTLEELNHPKILKELPKEKTGLILITGATGSGKSTTLAAVLAEINASRPVHVITLEDPVEYVHPHNVATFNQRELGTDFDTYPNGLRAALRQAPKVILVGEIRDRDTIKIALSAALRQAPKVILVGEIRDRDTIKIALSAAETGHLVLSTLHTTDAGATINRILGLFESEEQEQIRERLADTLRWVVSQRLVPKIGGGRTALLEIMGSNLRTQETVRLGESEGKSFYEIIEASYAFGWKTFDHACFEAYENGVITEEAAMQYCTKKGTLTRNIDKLKKTRGESNDGNANLRMKTGGNKSSFTGTAIPSLIKMK